MRVSEPVDDDSTSQGHHSELEESASQSETGQTGGDNAASSSGSDSEEAQVSIARFQTDLTVC